jgi:Type I phosphodiesterase / nucleotide pyrophosphatase
MTMRVVFVVIDALPNQWVGPVWTPHLWRLVTGGGWNPDGGRAVLSTATYPNHATFATGREPFEHGIFVNRVWDGEQFVGAHRIGPAGDTIFAAARRHDVASAVVVGDHKLIGVMGATSADRHWPLDGRRPDVALDEFRYAADSAVLDAIDSIDLVDTELAFVHFNGPDTACHMFGPHAPETGERIRTTDAAFGGLLDRLAPQWDDTVVMVVSDHDQETVTRHGIDLPAALERRGLPGIVENDGTAALVLDGPPVEMLLDLEEIAGARILDPRHTLVWGPPGHVFGLWLDELAGSHGSPRCATQVAVVGGGHLVVSDLAAVVAATRPDATWWAQAIAGLLELQLR